MIQSLSTSFSTEDSESDSHAPRNSRPVTIEVGRPSLIIHIRKMHGIVNPCFGKPSFIVHTGVAIGFPPKIVAAESEK